MDLFGLDAPLPLAGWHAAAGVLGRILTDTAWDSRSVWWAWAQDLKRRPCCEERLQMMPDPGSLQTRGTAGTHPPTHSLFIGAGGPPIKLPALPSGSHTLLLVMGGQRAAAPQSLAYVRLPAAMEDRNGGDAHALPVENYATRLLIDNNTRNIDLGTSAVDEASRGGCRPVGFSASDPDESCLADTERPAPLLAAPQGLRYAPNGGGMVRRWLHIDQAGAARQVRRRARWAGDWGPPAWAAAARPLPSRAGQAEQ